MTWTQEQIDQTLRAVVERSISDPAFRAAALQDGNNAIGKVSASAIPGDFRVRFVDNAGYDMTVVLPDAPSAGAPQLTLSDAELAGVSGGTAGGVGYTGDCPITVVPTINNHTACNPGYTKKPASPAFCPR